MGNKPMKRNPRSNPARGASGSGGSGRGCAAGKGKITGAAKARNNSERSRLKKEIVGDIADERFARPNQQKRPARRSTSPVSYVQEPSGEISAPPAVEKKSRHKKKSRTDVTGREGARLKQPWKLTGRSISPMSNTEASAEASSPSGQKKNQLIYAFPAEGAAGQLTGAKAVQEASAAPFGKKVKLYRDIFTGKKTKTQNEQQTERSEPEAHGSHDCSGSEEKGAGRWTGGETIDMHVTPSSQGISRVGCGEEITSVLNQEEGQQTECFDWDPSDIGKTVVFYVSKVDWGYTCGDDDEFWAELEGPELAKLKERLALYRIRAHELFEEGREQDVEVLEKEYSSSMLEAEGYFEDYEEDFEWYFDLKRCIYVGFEDYQRLMFRNTQTYLSFNHYQRINGTYLSDREFVKFYEKLEKETKPWVNHLENGKLEWKKFEALAFYQALKTAAGFRKITEDIFSLSLEEFMGGVQRECFTLKEHALLYFEIWKLVTVQKMDFCCALKQIQEQNICPIFTFDLELELRYEAEREGYGLTQPGFIKANYDSFVAEICPDAIEAQQLILDAVKIFIPKPMTYYDYVKKKLDVAEKIQLIPRESCS
ncbi:hypothetical protein EJB05_01749 [Eragrostis curvula]|uniref:Uncharacterized protein n=1 Tax=Eragrostis curvula TaxID=38414 RepID=A0A5J9WQB9_9POAL|nr:hypothetical protein EJB05_01749 [Eragrostis curvula]